MQRRANPGKLSRASKLRAWLAVAVLGLAGCTHTQNGATTLGDPLLGPAPPPAQATSPLHATTPQGNGLPPVPQSAGLNTNAALASQTPQPQSLAITQNTGWARTVGGTPAGAAPTGATPIAPTSPPKVLPVPTDTITAPTTAAIKQTGWSAASQPSAPNTAELEQQLKSHGVEAHEQVPEGTSIRLTVVVRNPANPSAVETLYTIAPDYPTAVAAIVREIDAKRAHP